MESILRKNVRLQAIAAVILGAIQFAGKAQIASAPTTLPTAAAYAKFAWPPFGNIFGDVPSTLIFADTRGDQSALKLYARRADTVWAYLPHIKSPSISVIVALPGKEPYEAKDSVLIGYDRAANAYVQVVGDQFHKDRPVVKVDPAGAVTIVTEAPGGLWKPGSDLAPPFSAAALGKTNSPTAGMILGDDRADKSQTQVMSKGKVSWTYNKPSSQPDEIRVVLMKADGTVRSPHAELKGFDSDKNAYVQMVTDIQEFNGRFCRIDPTGMPTVIDTLPTNLWVPSSPRNEAQAPQPVAPVAPKIPVVQLANGKFSVTFTNPDTNQQTSAEMERLAASKNPDTPFDGVYHNEKYMVMIRGTEIRVTPNRVPMGFQRPARPTN